MRVNVYAEELTHDTEIVTKKVPQISGGEVREHTFYGIRLFLKSPDELHHTPTDDDRSAVTFWVPFRGGANHFPELGQIFQRLLDRVHEAEVQERKSK